VGDRKKGYTQPEAKKKKKNGCTLIPTYAHVAVVRHGERAAPTSFQKAILRRNSRRKKSRRE
jgi:hypothetical protein